MKTTTKTTVFKNAALPYHPGVTRRRRTSKRAGYTDDVMRKNNGDKSQARRASTNVSIRRRRAGKRLVNYTRRTAGSQTGTSSGRTGCATGQTVNSSGERGGQYGRHKYDKWRVKDTVFYLILRMQDVVLILISTCLWGTMKSTPMMTDKDQQPSKYTAQLLTAEYQE